MRVKCQYISHIVPREGPLACQVVNIDTSEGIWLAGVSTNSDQFGVGYFKRNGFGSEGQDAVIITNDAAVPL